MPKQTKDWTDIYLDSYLTPKKREPYFGDEQERAIVDFNGIIITEKERIRLFSEIIEPAFRKIIGGVLEMPKFHYLGRLNREELIDATFYRMVEKMHKFNPTRVGKNG